METPSSLLKRLILFLVLCPFVATAQDKLPAYAFTNVTLHHADGDVTEGGAIVWRNGVIEAVGTGIDIPFDAMDVDGGDSLHVYPGFIDGMALWGSPDPKKELPNTTAGDPPYERAGVQPQRVPHKHLVEKDDNLSKAREHGFTTAALSLKGEMFPGQLDLFFLNGEMTGDHLYHEKLGLAAQLGTSRRAPGPVYPASVMGVLAKMRQVWFDAEALQDHITYYKSNPKGMEPPARNTVLEALFPVINKEVPFYFVAESNNNLGKIFRLQEDLDFPMVLVSANEAAEIADDVKSRAVPVLASFDLPDKPSWKKEEKKGDDKAEAKEEEGADEASDEKGEAEEEHLTEDEKAHREKQYEAWLARVNNVKELLDAGIEVGYASNGLSLADFKKNVKTMMEHGLTEQQLVKVLTVHTAKALGMDAVMPADSVRQHLKARAEAVARRFKRQYARADQVEQLEVAFVEKASLGETSVSVEFVVDGEGESHELRQDRRVTQVRADRVVGRLLRRRVLDLLEELLVFDAESSFDGSPLACGEQFHDLVSLHVLQLVERVAAVGELTVTAGSVLGTHLLPPRPVRLDAMSPTFRPGGASRETDFGLPGCWRPPPPNGWSTAFIATPRTRGHLVPRAFILWCFFPALTYGFSVRPPPATTPMVARQSGLSRLTSPEGSFTTATRRSWVSRLADVPDARANFPPSPGFDSTLQTGTPSGISASGSVFPGFISAETPTCNCSPTVMPSGARTRRWSPSSNSTAATGADRAGSCSMSTTVPETTSVSSVFLCCRSLL